MFLYLIPHLTCRTGWVKLSTSSYHNLPYSSSVNNQLTLYYWQTTFCLGKNFDYAMATVTLFLGEYSVRTGLNTVSLGSCDII
jgi:hypothetical protein